MTAAAINVQNQYLNPWLAMGSLFIPVIPTHSANLAGTASILANWWIGQGVETFGFTGVANNLYQFSNQCWQGELLVRCRAAEKIRRFCPGPVLLQQPVVHERRLRYQQGLWRESLPVDASRRSRVWRPGIMAWAHMGDNAQTIQQMAITLWYRPIQAIKFGLQYAYAAARYFQYILPTAATNGIGTPANNVNRSDFGQDHRVEFVGFFYF